MFGFHFIALIFIVFISFFYIIITTSDSFSIIEEPNKCNKADTITEITEPEETHTVQNEIHIDWILTHSYRISRKTATEIYNTAMSMDNGLLLIAIASRESSFSPTAVSKKGAIGINQIMPEIWVKELQEQEIIEERRDLFDYDKNFLASNYILTKYYNALGSWEKALQKYVGKGHESYVKDVLALYGELQLLKNTNS